MRAGRGPRRRPSRTSARRRTASRSSTTRRSNGARRDPTADPRSGRRAHDRTPRSPPRTEPPSREEDHQRRAHEHARPITLTATHASRNSPLPAVDRHPRPGRAPDAEDASAVVTTRSGAATSDAQLDQRTAERDAELERADRDRAADEHDHAEIDVVALERRRGGLGHGPRGQAAEARRERRGHPDRLPVQDRHARFPALVFHGSECTAGPPTGYPDGGRRLLGTRSRPARPRRAVDQEARTLPAEQLDRSGRPPIRTSGRSRQPVFDATWGVTITSGIVEQRVRSHRAARGRRRRALHRRGDRRSSASISAASSTTGPRLTLIRYAPVAHQPELAAPDEMPVSAVSEVWRLTKSDRARRSSRLAAASAHSHARRSPRRRTGRGRATRIPSPRAQISPTRRPIRPKPTSPSVRPRTSVPWSSSFVGVRSGTHRGARRLEALGEREQHRDGVLGRALGRSVGRVGGQDAPGRAGRHVDPVVADAVADDHA